MTGLRADGWHRTARLASLRRHHRASHETRNSRPPKHRRSAVQLQKLNQRWDAKDDYEVCPILRIAGLARNNEYPLQRIGGKDEKGIHHTFGRLANDRYFMAREPNTKELHAYWVGLDFKVIAAIAKAEDQSLSVLPTPAAQEELESEYQVWAEHADGLK